MAKMQAGQIVAEVTRKEYITPHFIRVYLHSEEVSQFRNTTIGDNNKIAIPPQGLNEIHFPTWGDNHEWIYPEKEIAPSIRTYTHRGINWETNELYIDFVDHGDGGPASKWAREAEKGSKLGVMMRTEPRELYPQVDWYFLIGDGTAIPVLGAILEALPETAKGVCIIEVHGKEDEQKLETKAAIEFIWVHNQDSHLGNNMTQTVKSVKIPETSKFGYLACELSTVKEVRNYFRKEKNWKQSELYAYSYWKAGLSQDQSQSERRKDNSDH
ncbi:NADPH-dependent ferric siderophore reductase [Chryseobacterium sp. T16E-39]|uniref:siderophore-interacting protein n=1 Tax=Chryseobacterium sp. T16E-39 TaxID=2015076 RepID=UPI000B5B3090|nr:siderophore-interacting protein [Chryseobacterium sp. T16E-39]ASK28595.1 NADPH-dependent ferric siderophore reductase [Chryseobacterium sp. T16E-39]